MVIDISKITLENLEEYKNIKRCVICGKEFKAKRRTQETCSQNCSSKKSYRKRKKTVRRLI